MRSSSRTAINEKSKLVLYHAAHSTCSQKVQLVLHEKGLPFEDIRIDLSKKEQLKREYLAINANGVVPTLVEDGTPIISRALIANIWTKNIRTILWCRRHRRARPNAIWTTTL